MFGAFILLSGKKLQVFVTFKVEFINQELAYGR